MKYFVPILIFSICIFSRLDRHFLKQNGSFCPKYILPNWSRCPQFETSPAGNLDTIFDQPFTYLTKGKQSFVFVSEDQKWVIKLVRLPRYVMRRSLKGNLSSLILFTKTLTGYKGAYEDLQEETGVVYAHLKPTQNLGNISLIDALGVSHTLALDEMAFVVQKCGDPFFPALEKSQDPKALIRKTVQLYSNLYRKGYIDRDPILDKNFGVLGEDPFIIDIGQLEKCQHGFSQEEHLEKMTQSLSWKLQRDCPDLYLFYRNLLH
ncbi:MAG: hypothetical protein K1000chlam2_00878 [Chlamydiae bacterium]|nr:hypothetical protein [Chlamydiota bacterium]